MNRNVAIAAVALVLLVAVAAVFVLSDGDDVKESNLKESFAVGDYIEYEYDNEVVGKEVVTEVYADGTYQIVRQNESKEYQYMGGARASYQDIVTLSNGDVKKEKLGIEVIDTAFGEIECIKYEVTQSDGSDNHSYLSWEWKANGLCVQKSSDGLLSKVVSCSLLKGDRTPGLDSWVPVPKEVGKIPEGLKVDTPRTETAVGDWYVLHYVDELDGKTTEWDDKIEALEIRDGKVLTDADEGTWEEMDYFTGGLYIPTDNNGYAKAETSVMNTAMGERVVTKYVYHEATNDGEIKSDIFCEIYLGEDGVIYKYIMNDGGWKTTTTLVNTNMLKTE